MLNSMGQNIGLSAEQAQAIEAGSAADSWNSVIKLAQAGNLRAIAFWINRHLVPQGICAQVLAEQPGHLLIRVVCHQTPDRDTLVRFICQRLHSLKSEMIRTVRIRAQLVGSAQPLWEQAMRMVAATPDPTVVQSVAPTTTGRSVAQTAVNPYNAIQANPFVPPPPGATSSSQSVAQSLPAQSVPTPAAPAQPAPVPGQQPHLKHPAPPKRKKLKRPRSLAQWSRHTVHQISTLPETAKRVSRQSTNWLLAQSMPIRVLTIGGTAMAVFLLGCGLELLRQYAIDPSLGKFSAETGISLPLGVRPHSVTTAENETVPVIQTAVSNPDDPAVTLLFSNSAALGRAPKPHTSEANLSGASYETGGLTAYRLADLVMTSLAEPLTLQQVLPESSLASPTAGTLAEGETPPNLPLPEQGAIGSGDFDATSEAEGFGTTGVDATEFDPTETDSQQAETIQKTTIHELLANGVDIVNVAATDQQTKTPELVQTLDVLKRSNIFSLGAGQEAKASRRPQVFDVKGQRVAYLGYSDPSLATKLAIAAGLAPDMTSQMVADLEAIRSQVDWVLVSFRWQRNLRAYPEDWQVKLAHQAIDHGADLVVGYHPHLTQGAEIYQGRAIVYSLGQSMEEYDEAYSDYGYEEETRPEQDTVSLKLTLEDKTMKLEFLPVQIRQGKVTLAEGETAEKILSAMQQASSFLEQPMQSPTVLDARLRVSLPSAPDTHEIKTEPFLAEPESTQ